MEKKEFSPRKTVMGRQESEFVMHETYDKVHTQPASLKDTDIEIDSSYKPGNQPGNQPGSNIGQARTDGRCTCNYVNEHGTSICLNCGQALDIYIQETEPEKKAPVSPKYGTLEAKPFIERKPSGISLIAYPYKSNNSRLVCFDSDTDRYTLTRGLLGPDNNNICEKQAELIYHFQLQKWILRDISPNKSTFVQVSESELYDGDELLLGNQYLRFEINPDYLEKTNKKENNNEDSSRPLRRFVPKQSAEVPLSQPDAVVAFWLRVKPYDSGIRIPVYKNELPGKIGRNKFENNNQMISEEHVLISFENSVFYIKDISEHKETFIKVFNQNINEDFAECELVNGIEVLFGDRFFKVIID